MLRGGGSLGCTGQGMKKREKKDTTRRGRRWCYFSGSPMFFRA